jgi:predicted phage-related endonuclease
MRHYIVIDGNRKIITRQLEGQKLLEGAIEVSKEVFDTSIQEEHNYLNEELVTELRDMRTPEEIAEEERLPKLPTAEELQKNKIELVALDLLLELGAI